MGSEGWHLAPVHDLLKPGTFRLRRTFRLALAPFCFAAEHSENLISPSVETRGCRFSLMILNLFWRHLTHCAKDVQSLTDFG